MRVLIKGAGVAGLTVALELTRRGIEVEVVERAAAVATGASGLAGGMLAPWCERESADEAVLTLGKTAADWWGGGPARQCCPPRNIGGRRRPRRR